MTRLPRLILVVLVCVACPPSSGASREAVTPSPADLQHNDSPRVPSSSVVGSSDGNADASVTASAPPASTVVPGISSATIATPVPVVSTPPPAPSASAAIIVEKSVPNDLAPRRPPSIQSCNDRMPNPECFSAFPEKVTCPAALSDVPLGSYCGLIGRTQGPKRCTYPQGVCTRANKPYCGGAYPTMLQQSGMTWACQPPRMADDCPEAAAGGKSCRKAGQTCGYGGCGTSTQCTCTNGKYKCTTEHWPTPP
jgi:hypothetical protein